MRTPRVLHFSAFISIELHVHGHVLWLPTLSRVAETESGKVMWEQWGWWSEREVLGNWILHVGHSIGLHKHVHV